MIAGGADELHPTQIAIFDTLYATSQKNAAPERTPSPFDKDRDGLVIGEGAGTMILEEYEHAKKRGAKIYAEVIGFGTSTDGTHITSPNRDKMKSALELALKDANISPDEIGYVNAHGTATIQGDLAESNATYDIFKRPVPVSSIKSYTGHTLGACGAVEAILTLDMAYKNWFCPTINLTTVDEECGKLDQNDQRHQERYTAIVHNKGCSTLLSYNNMLTKKCFPPLPSTMKSTLFNAYNIIFHPPVQAFLSGGGIK